MGTPANELETALCAGLNEDSVGIVGDSVKHSTQPTPPRWFRRVIDVQPNILFADWIIMLAKVSTQ